MRDAIRKELNKNEISHWRCFACSVVNLTTSLVCRNCHKRRWEHLGFKALHADKLLERING